MRRPTFCNECDHVEPSSRKKLPPYWLCMKHPRLEGMGFVAPNLWAEMEPHMRCVNINGGNCPLWEPRRQANHEPKSKELINENL